MTRLKKRNMTRRQPVSDVCKIEGCGKPKKHPRAFCIEHLKMEQVAYQQQYYLDHREEAKLYQRLYNRQHKKSTSRQTAAKPDHKVKKTTFTISDLQNATGDKLFKRLTKVLNGEQGLVRAR